MRIKVKNTVREYGGQEGITLSKRVGGLCPWYSIHLASNEIVLLPVHAIEIIEL